MSNITDHGKYFCINADTRDLNYSKYFVEGNPHLMEEYTSHNTQRLGVEETIDLLMKLGFIKQNLDGHSFSDNHL